MEIEEIDETGDWEYTVEDYVRIEEESINVKHEFVDGQIRAMSGGTLEHSRLMTALAVLLGNQLEGKPCAMYSSDGRVRIAGLITYPDLSIGCGRLSIDAEDRNAQLNPCVLFEVTSKSSEKYDRGKKRVRYLQIPSLREYVIVSHRAHAVDVFERDASGVWREPRRYGPGERASLPSLGIEIDVDKLYADPRRPRD